MRARLVQRLAIPANISRNRRNGGILSVGRIKPVAVFHAVKSSRMVSTSLMKVAEIKAFGIASIETLPRKKEIGAVARDATGRLRILKAG